MNLAAIKMGIIFCMVRISKTDYDDSLALRNKLYDAEIAVLDTGESAIKSTKETVAEMLNVANNSAGFIGVMCTENLANATYTMTVLELTDIGSSVIQLSEYYRLLLLSGSAKWISKAKYNLVKGGYFDRMMKNTTIMMQSTAADYRKIFTNKSGICMGNINMPVL